MRRFLDRHPTLSAMVFFALIAAAVGLMGRYSKHKNENRSTCEHWCSVYGDAGTIDEYRVCVGRCTDG